MDMMEQTATMTETIFLSDTAVDMIKDLLVQKEVPDYGLRVFVSGGGCSGLQYGMALEAEAQPYDSVIESKGVKVFIDPTSMMYLNQATIDYEESLMGGGFKIENPNAVSSCGCGHSFKTEEQGYTEGGGCASGCGHN